MFPPYSLRAGKTQCKERGDGRFDVTFNFEYQEPMLKSNPLSFRCVEGCRQKYSLLVIRSLDHYACPICQGSISRIEYHRPFKPVLHRSNNLNGYYTSLG